MRNISFRNVGLKDGFWKNRWDIHRHTTLRCVYERFKDSGRIDAFRCDYDRETGKGTRAHYFWDSDVAKWIEAASYCLEKAPDPDLEEKIEWIVDRIEEHADPDGYFNIYFLTVEPENRFRDRMKHELYCAGHLMEAAVAYKKATGRDRFLRLMERYADYIYRVFVEEGSAGFRTPGHEEIELALVRMYEETGNLKYLDLARFFVNKRGTEGPDAPDRYTQSHVPVREFTEAVGHAVRAVYLYSAMADLARIDSDAGLKEACMRLFRSITEEKMYITGGIGSNSCGEAFAYPFYLPNLNAYAETCAAIGLVFFLERMQEIDINSRYADVIERVIYNGALCGISLDGRNFFYRNPMEIRPGDAELQNMSYSNTQRPELFECSCCPPNVARFFASIGDLAYSVNGNTIYVQQFMSSDAEIGLPAGKITLTQTTDYPLSGKITFESTSDVALAIRIPWWSRAYSDLKDRDGYMRLKLKSGRPLTVDLGMEAGFVRCDPRVRDNVNKTALMRGPVVYCAEGVDNGGGLDCLMVDPLSRITVLDENVSLPVLQCSGARILPESSLYQGYGPVRAENVKIRFIPYHATENRGETAMKVWLDIEPLDTSHPDVIH